MARQGWFDENNELPLIDERVNQLEHYTNSIADGVIDKDELSKQQEALVQSMKAVESELSEEQHAKVTALLVELSAYNIMKLLHELANERLKKVFK